MYDRLLKSLIDSAKQCSYPPVNVIKKDENQYSIELALAGFAKKDIDVKIDGSSITVKSNATESKIDSDEFLYKGISSKDFFRAFDLVGEITVPNVEYVNGLLKIMFDARSEPADVEIKETK